MFQEWVRPVYNSIMICYCNVTSISQKEYFKIDIDSGIVPVEWCIEAVQLKLWFEMTNILKSLHTGLKLAVFIVFSQTILI